MNGWSEEQVEAIRSAAVDASHRWDADEVPVRKDISYGSFGAFIADAVVVALEAVTPDDTRTEWGVRKWNGQIISYESEAAARSAAEHWGGEVVTRTVGPWLPAPTSGPAS